MADDIRRIIDLIGQVGNVAGLGPDDDFYDAGFSSVNSLGLLLELESELGVSVPDDDFIAARTARALNAMINRLKQEQFQ